MRSLETRPRNLRAALALAAFPYLAVAGLLSIAPAAFASVPDWVTRSTGPRHIDLVGSDGATGDRRGEFLVTVMDLAGERLPGVVVQVDFSRMRDARFSQDQLGCATADCETRTVRKQTDTYGVATFAIIGGSAAGPPLSLGGDVRIYVGGELLSTIEA